MRTALRLVAAAMALSACRGAAGPQPATVDGAAAPGVSGRVTVFAAASLTEVFEQIADDLEAERPDVDVVLSFGASSALAQQIAAGAPADVFAAASPATMRTVTDSGDATDPRVFARNRLQIAVPRGNPGRVTGLADFADSELTLALCAPAVPCGAAARTALDAAAVTAAPDTLEQDVRAALAKVRLGEVDAALVYRTDVLAAGDQVEGIFFPEADTAVNDYPVAALASARHAAAAEAFVEHVLSAKGREVLLDAGFDVP